MSQRPETTKRVSLTLTLATDADPNLVLAGVTTKLGTVNEAVVGTSVHGFDLADDEPGEPCVQLVIDDGLLAAVYVDRPERASEHARGAGCVVAELPIAQDYRSRVTQEADPR